MSYINERLENIINETIKGNYSIKDIGHHQLGRHYVYEITGEDKSEYILKIYGKAFRFCNEIIGLELLNEKIICPNIINKSKSESEVEWLLMNKLDGVVLEDVWNDITTDNKIAIIEKLGELMGKMHSCYKYDYYGIWETCGTAILNHKNFIEYRKDKDRVIINNIISQQLPHMELLADAYYNLTKYYQTLFTDSSPRLCHHDFSPRNILVVKDDEYWRVNGIIDFEHCYPDDPDIDFTDLYQTIFLDEPYLAKYLINGYSKYMSISEDLAYKMQYYLLNKGLFICSWAYEYTIDYYNQGVNLLRRLLYNNP
ncbi:aminoglycoside phosphotransferase family protein [Brassicibacter mesophilus]|uniref:aminoglycoside phosphotransferase family protein n=1 Tax=Brassicibacter mesophilus TaxID=745119 RepID=UPI003D2553B3